MVDKLYEASNAGVKIQMIIRGICCLIPGIKGMSENIEVISIVDKFLEHTRLYVFGNNNNPKIYISSADWMTRNIENRVEVSCPIYDENIKKELLETFDISWNDNVKARMINENQDNEYRKNNKTKPKNPSHSHQHLQQTTIPSQQQKKNPTLQPPRQNIQKSTPPTQIPKRHVR